jgi:hypothetical protein
MAIGVQHISKFRRLAFPTGGTMNAEQMELLERLARLRDLGAISRREFLREKESVLRVAPRPATLHLRALPAPGQSQAAVALVPQGPSALPARARSRAAPERTESSLLERLGRGAGWVLWTLFSIGGLAALIEHDPLEALSLLLCGLLLAPPFHRLLATRLALPTRLAITAVGVIAALGIGTAPPGHTGRLAPILPPEAAAACGEAVSHAAVAGGERAREGIARPWRKFWSDLVWARVAGLAVLDEWQTSRG